MVQELESQGTEGVWLTSKEASVKANLHQRTILNALNRGRLEGIKVPYHGGGDSERWMISSDSLDVFIESYKPRARKVDERRLADIREVWKRFTSLEPEACDLNCPEECKITCDLNPDTKCPDIG